MTRRHGASRRTRLAALALVLVPLLAAPTGAAAAFPGSNGVIAFGSDAGGDQEILTIDPATGAVTELTTNSGDDDFDPSFSPDGERIAFTSDRSQGIAIWAMGAGGENPVLVGPDATDFTQFEPAYSPDGRSIVFRRNYPIIDGDIWVMGADGSNPTELTAISGVPDLTPTYSPDGSTIAFTRLDSGSTIFTMGSDGSNPAPLTPGSHPDYSPDGRSIVYSQAVGGNDELFLLPLGGSPVRLTNTAADESNPAFSPDGRFIVFERFDGSDTDLALINADGTDPRPLTETPFFETSPSWQPLNPPALEFSVPAKQKSLRTITVTAISRNEGAALTISGAVTAPKPRQRASASKKKTVALAPVSAQLAPGVPATIEIAIPKQARKLLKRAIAAGRKGTAALTATATAPYFNETSTQTASVKIKKKKKKK